MHTNIRNYPLMLKAITISIPFPCSLPENKPFPSFTSDTYLLLSLPACQASGGLFIYPVIPMPMR